MNFHNHQHANHYAQGYCVITQMVDARVKTIVEFNVKFYDKKQDQERRGGWNYPCLKFLKLINLESLFELKSLYSQEKLIFTWISPLKLHNCIKIVHTQWTKNKIFNLIFSKKSRSKSERSDIKSYEFLETPIFIFEAYTHLDFFFGDYLCCKFQTNF